MYCLGIDIGASSVKMAVVDANGAVLRVLRRAHKGSPLPCLGALLDELADAGDSLLVDRRIIGILDAICRPEPQPLFLLFGE